MATRIKTLEEKNFDAYLEARKSAESSDGLVSEALADAYLVVTGAVFPAEFIGQPLRNGLRSRCNDQQAVHTILFGQRPQGIQGFLARAGAQHQQPIGTTRQTLQRLLRHYYRR